MIPVRLIGGDAVLLLCDETGIEPVAVASELGRERIVIDTLVHFPDGFSRITSNGVVGLVIVYVGEGRDAMFARAVVTERSPDGIGGRWRYTLQVLDWDDNGVFLLGREREEAT